MKRQPYMDESWYAVLTQAVADSTMTAVARRLDVSRGAVSQVLNGTGLYGSGQANTARFGERVMKMLSQMRCPFLSDTAGEERFISGEECRAYAYREAPTNSPMANRHWRACRDCVARVPAPRNWDERSLKFIEIRAERAITAGVAAPVPPTSTEKEAAHE